MNKNKGFTMIELLLVVCIMGVVMGSGVLSMNYIRYANTKKCAAKVNSMLEEVRTITMTRKNHPYLYLYYLDGSYYAKISDLDPKVTNLTAIKDDQGVKLGNSELRIQGTYEVKTNPGGVIVVTECNKLVETSVIAIGFDRVTGAYLEQADSDIGNTNNLLYYYHKLRITGKNGTYEITLSKYTGAHSLK